jgi:hypothetical protein
MGAFLSAGTAVMAIVLFFTSHLPTAHDSTRLNCGSRSSLAGCSGMVISIQVDQLIAALEQFIAQWSRRKAHPFGGRTGACPWLAEP